MGLAIGVGIACFFITAFAFAFAGWKKVDAQSADDNPCGEAHRSHCDDCHGPAESSVDKAYECHEEASKRKNEGSEEAPKHYPYAEFSSDAYQSDRVSEDGSQDERC